MQSRVALRERALLDVLDLAFRFCAARGRAFAKLSSVVLVPGFALSWALSWAYGWWLAWPATLVMTGFAGAPFVALASRLVFADEVTTWETIRAALRVVPRLIGVRALQALALGLSIVLFGMPWLWMGTSLLFAVEALLLEYQGGIGAALTRARRIAVARFGVAMSGMIVLAAAPLAAAMVADVAGREVLGGILEIRPPPSLFQEGGSWLALAGWWAILPLTSTAHFFLYLDIRTRAEGWDIQTRFAAIAARAHAERREHVPRAWSAGGAALLILALWTVSGDARAAMDSAHARADVEQATAEKAFAFCRQPSEPLTVRARSLCPHAIQIPNCQGFAAACARAELAERERSPSTPSGDWARRGLAMSGIAGMLARMVVWALVLAVVAAILVPIASAIARVRRRGAVESGRGDVAAGAEVVVADGSSEPSEEILLARADRLARRGENAAALELYLAASLRALGRRGAVVIAHDRTNGEYVRSCADDTAKSLLRTMARDVDRVKFGGEQASTDAVGQAGRHAATIVRMSAAALLMLVVVTLPGCVRVGRQSQGVGADPAGDELWYEVLRRQGVRAERLDVALASLPPPPEDKQSPAVVVDVERTELDAETRDHLVQWVGAGGVLVLAGDPHAWPHELEAGSRSAVSREETHFSVSTDPRGHADLASGAAFEFAGEAEHVAWFDDGSAYAAALPLGKGLVLGIASDELMTNAGLARGENAAAMVAIFSRADRVNLRMAQEDDGLAPPSTPIAALSRAGLGIGLVHALIAIAVLFLAVGVRLARPKPSPPRRRRAFAEHVEAVGSLYARAGAARHALAAYARFAEGRLRARMPRSATDVASFLAYRAHSPLDACRRLWGRAMAAKDGAAAQGDELPVLEELSTLCTAAMGKDT
jgi:hypothetical protein